jgi:hypothetical protein
MTSIGGERFPTSSRHLLTRVARMIRDANPIGALSVSDGWMDDITARSKGSHHD